jgi:hypothetical protein
MLLNLKLGNNFLCVPKLPADRKGFIIWKEQLKLLIQACGLYGHLIGTTARLDNPLTRPAGAGALTAEQVSTIERYTKDMS